MTVFNNMQLRTKDCLQRLIDEKIEESTVLEYKASFAVQNTKWREELAKDVSAMANSNGGTVIFGIKQKDTGNGHAVAHKLTPIPISEMSKDKLSQLLSSNIQPIIDNLEITYIPDGNDCGFFVVDIPQSNTAHQNRLTHIYYKRRNATVEAMEDYEVRDVMNRSKTPIIDIDFQLIRTEVDIVEKDYNYLMRGGVQLKKSKRIDYKLKYRPVNNGHIYAKYINYFIYIPSDIVVEKDEYDIDGDYFVVFDDNTTRDLLEISGMQKKYGPVRYEPILPGICGKSHRIELCFDNVDVNHLPCIRCEIHADNAPPRLLLFNWNEIELVNETKNEIIDPMASPRIPGY